MAEDEHEPQRSFKVEDRRRFSSTGEARDEAGAQTTTKPAAETAEAAATATARAEEPRQAPRTEITFSTFLISLSTQALAHLGEIPDPVDGATRVDLDAARQIIDILGMLSEKTRGNLDASEISLLDHALYDLRMRYVERAQGR